MRSRWLGFLIAAVAIAASLWALPRLPATVPTHWNFRGEPDGYSSRFVAAAIMPLVILGFAGLLQVLPKIDPRSESYARFADTYWLLVNGILLFMAVLHLVILANGLGAPVNVARVVPAGVGLLFVLIGSYLGRVQPNWFIGIRTPWTLSSDIVWRATHRTGGWLFIVGGLVMIAGTFLRSVAVIVVFVLTIALVVIVPVVQSYLLWRREKEQ